jgi:hypothetical protein
MSSRQSQTSSAPAPATMTVKQPQDYSRQKLQTLLNSPHTVKVYHRINDTQAPTLVCGRASATLLCEFSPTCRRLIDGTGGVRDAFGKKTEITITGSKFGAVMEVLKWLHRVCDDKRAQLDIPDPKAANFVHAHHTAEILGMEILAAKLMKVVTAKLYAPLTPTDVFALAPSYITGSSYMQRVAHNLSYMIHHHGPACPYWVTSEKDHLIRLGDEYPDLAQSVYDKLVVLYQKNPANRRRGAPPMANPFTTTQIASPTPAPLVIPTPIAKPAGPSWASIAAQPPSASTPVLTPLPAPVSAKYAQTGATPDGLSG